MKLSNRFKTFLQSSLPERSIAYTLKEAGVLILIFTVFYFAIFKFNAPLSEIYRDFIEFLSVGFSLFSSFLILWVFSLFYSKVFKKPLIPNYAFAPVFFLFIYTVAILILYPIKQTLWEIEKDWVWRYYWRHFPYALLIFGVYLYREYKGLMISNLVEELNSRLVKEDTSSQDTKAESSIIKMKVDGIDRNIPLSRISHISVGGHYLDITLQEGEAIEQICVRKSMNEITEDLPPYKFLRIHRSHLVNLDFIKRLQKKNGRYFVEIQNHSQTLPISRNNLAKVLSKLEAQLIV